MKKYFVIASILCLLGLLMAGPAAAAESSRSA
jgi:hypothetical protein